MSGAMEPTAAMDAPEIVEIGEPAPAPVAPRPPARSRRAAFSNAFAGVDAIMVKELRGRMRGRRAFVVLTFYLLVLAGFAWMVELILEAQHTQFGGQAAQASARIGQGVFIALLILETIMVVVLAPSFTAGGISQEREKQTLDLLAATPISSLAIVVGKLISALTYVLMLILASIPLTAIVFVYGGAGPEDVIRGYVVLLATAIGLGAIGVFFSALLRRTQAASVITYVALLVLTLGSVFIWVFWSAMGARQTVEFRPGEEGGTFTVPARPPEALFYLNPFVAQADVACGTETGFGGFCGIITTVTGQDIAFIPRPAPIDVPDRGVGAQPGSDVVVDDGIAAPDQFGIVRDRFWPKSVAAWLVLSVILILASVQLVTPTRRWRPGRPRLPRPSRSTT